MFERFVFLLCLSYSANAALAPFITKCNGNDEKCLKESAQKVVPIFAAGLPELGVEQLDPMYLKSLDASANGLKLFLQDVKGTGLKDCVIKKIKRDLSASKMTTKLQCDVDFVGKYEMKGLLLIIPIEGKGDARVVLNKLIIVVESDMGETTGSDGQKHWTVKNWKHQFEVKDKSIIKLDNLFNGNQALAYAANELLTNSSNEIVKEVGPPIVRAIVEKIIENVKHFFATVPANELSID